MTISLKKTAIAALVSLGAIGSIPAAASAASVDFYFGTGGAGMRMHDGYRDHRHHDRRDRWESRRGCSSRTAVRKARHFGLRHARVAYESRHKVVVEGRHHHRYDRIVFANVDGCPVIRY